MFLTGCFMESMNTTLSEHSLDLVGRYLPKTKRIAYVQDSLYTLVTKRLDKEWSGMSEKQFIYTGWDESIRASVKTKLDKLKKKEFNIGVREDGESKLPTGVVDENILSSDLSLVPQSVHRWEVFLNKLSVDTYDFRIELAELIEEYNRVSRFFETTYGLNFRLLLKKVLEGDKDSQEYLVDILSEENDKVFVDTLAELLHYDEFKDFIYSEEDNDLEVGVLYV
jgi:hypothetical protein